MRIGGAPSSAPHAQCFYLRTTRMKGRTDADGRAAAAVVVVVGARTKKDGRECNHRSGGSYAAAAPTYSEDEDVRRAKEGRKYWREGGKV